MSSEERLETTWVYVSTKTREADNSTKLGRFVFLKLKLPLPTLIWTELGSMKMARHRGSQESGS